MRVPPNSRDIERWYPQHWREIAGNSEMIQGWMDFIVHGRVQHAVHRPESVGQDSDDLVGRQGIVVSKSDIRP